MNHRLRWAFVPVLVLLVSCGDDVAEVRRGTEQRAGVLVPTDLVVDDSCGHRFVMRDRDGSTRLTIAVDSSAADDGVPPGTYQLGFDGWSGRLEMGRRLNVWPCHDIGTDFDREQVDEVWSVVDGQVEVTRAIPPVPDGGGGVSEEVGATAIVVVLESPDGETTELHDIELVSDRWGFYGG